MLSFLFHFGLLSDSLQEKEKKIRKGGEGGTSYTIISLKISNKFYLKCESISPILHNYS